jgi:uncharacterized protein YegL
MGWVSYREDIMSRMAGDSRAETSQRASSTRVTTTQATKQGRPNEEPNMSKLKEFTAATARPLPVIILADTSGSMSENGKIEALNTALADMVGAFGEEGGGRAEIHVAIITFGGTAQVHQDFVAASKITIRPLGATGITPMGGAFDIARDLVDDRQKVPGRAYTPTIVLVSDGQPNDTWEPALARLLESERAKKAQRFALGIGADADAAILRRFLANPEGKVYGAADARQIKNFFRWVTMSVTARSRSTNPNAAVVGDFPPSDLDELL